MFEVGQKGDFIEKRKQVLTFPTLTEGILKLHVQQLPAPFYLITVTSWGCCNAPYLPSAPPTDACTLFLPPSLFLSYTEEMQQSLICLSQALSWSLTFFSWWIQSLCDMAMSISVQSLGLILLAAVLLQTIAVAVSFMYFNKVLNTVRNAFGLRGTQESEWEASNMVSWHASWEQAKLTKNTDLHWGMRLIPVEQDKYDRGQRNCILKHELQMTCGPQI